MQLTMPSAVHLSTYLRLRPGEVCGHTSLPLKRRVVEGPGPCAKQAIGVRVDYYGERLAECAECAAWDEAAHAARSRY